MPTYWVAAATIAILGFYFRRPLGACFARVRRLPEVVARLRGRFDAANSEELQDLTSPNRRHAADDDDDDMELGPEATPIVMRGRAGGGLSGRRSGGGGGGGLSATAAAAAAIRWETEDDDAPADRSSVGSCSSVAAAAVGADLSAAGVNGWAEEGAPGDGWDGWGDDDEDGWGDDAPAASPVAR